MTNFYNQKKWHRKRANILKRDKYLCRNCVRYGIEREAIKVHHVYPLIERPDLKLNEHNLISLCDDCHRKMHNNLTGTLSLTGLEWAERLTKQYPELSPP